MTARATEAITITNNTLSAPSFHSAIPQSVEEAKLFDFNEPTNTSCVNWNQYYTTCKQSGENPFQGTISFDNIGMAWVAIFLVSSIRTLVDLSVIENYIIIFLQAKKRKWISRSGTMTVLRKGTFKYHIAHFQDNYNHVCYIA